MRLASLIFTLVASSSMIMAAPTQEDGVAKRGCPNGWTYCGVCNGTSCKVAASNIECQEGTSCVGEGGGDGAICGGADTWWEPQICPVKV